MNFCSFFPEDHFATEIDDVNFEGSITFQFPMSINQCIRVKSVRGSVLLTTPLVLPSEIATPPPPLKKLAFTNLKLHHLAAPYCLENLLVPLLFAWQTEEKSLKVKINNNPTEAEV